MKVIALSGKKRAGKNYTMMFAKAILDEDDTGRVVKVAFADALKKMALEEHGWNGKKDAAGRKLLQDLGVGMRDRVGINYWVTRWRDTVQHLAESPTPPDVVFVTDARFPNEANTVKEMGGAVWRIERRGLESTDTHVSETAMDDYPFFDHVITTRNLDEAMAYSEWMDAIRDGLKKAGLLEP